MSVTGCGLGFGGGGGGRGCVAAVLRIWNQRQENRGEVETEGRGPREGLRGGVAVQSATLRFTAVS